MKERFYQNPQGLISAPNLKDLLSNKNIPGCAQGYRLNNCCWLRLQQLFPHNEDTLYYRLEKNIYQTFRKLFAEDSIPVIAQNDVWKFQIELVQLIYRMFQPADSPRIFQQALRGIHLIDYFVFELSRPVIFV